MPTALHIKELQPTSRSNIRFTGSKFSRNNREEFYLIPGQKSIRSMAALDNKVSELRC